MSEEVKRLWEVDHAYYCQEGNYYANDNHTEYKRWSDFIDEFADADLDYNLLFRWDWKEDEETPFNGDLNYRNGRLLLFFMAQRKARCYSCEVEVCRADEPAVIAYLQPRLDYLAKLWEPLTAARIKD